MVKCTVPIKELRRMVTHRKIFQDQVCMDDTYQYGPGNYKLPVLEGVNSPGLKSNCQYFD